MENNDEKKNLFERLKEIRIEKGIRIEMISENSRIQTKYLHALEEGDILSIPEVYDKLFFRSYLKALDVKDEEAYFEEFLQIRGKLRIDKTTSMIHISESSREATKNLLSHRNLFVILPVVLIIIVLAILLMNTEMIGTASQGKVQEIDIKNVVQRIEAKQQAKIDSMAALKDAERDSVSFASAPSSKLSLRINAVKKTWFRMVSDKSDTSEYLLNAGQKIISSADHMFEFLIGRDDGLSFNLNGKILSKAGSDSSVVLYMRIDSTGVAAKILKTENTSEKNDESL